MEEEWVTCAFDGLDYPESEMVEVSTPSGSELVHEDNVDDFICEKKYGSDYYNGH